MSEPEQPKADIIRDGAFEVLLSEGLGHLSYDRIAKATGVTRQLVRYYYPKPDDLMLTLCDALAERYREILIKGVMGQADHDRLRTFFDFYFDLLDGQAKPRDDQVYDALLSLSASSDAIRTNLRNQYTLLGRTLAHELRTSHRDIPLKACEEIAYLFVTIMYGHWKMVATLGLSEDHKHIARQAIDRIIASYIGNSAPVPGVDAWKSRD